MQPNVQITQGATPTAVSDQARTAPEYTPSVRSNRTEGPAPAPGQPYHATSFGALGTDGSIPPKSAMNYSTAPVAPIAPVAPATTAQLGVVPPAIQQVETAVADVAPPQVSAAQTAQPAVAPVAPAISNDNQRIDNLEAQLGSIANTLSAITTQLNIQTLVKPSLPGTSNPKAPEHHAGTAVQGIVPKINGPAIPSPSNVTEIPAAAKDPLGLEGLHLEPGEEDLTTVQYIEKHFRLRDLSIDQIAYMTRMDSQEVIQVLKELGYQFQDGV